MHPALKEEAARSFLALSGHQCIRKEEKQPPLPKGRRCLFPEDRPALRLLLQVLSLLEWLSIQGPGARKQHVGGNA